MSVGPVFLMFSDSFKTDIEIISGASAPFFMPSVQNHGTAICDILWYEPDHLDFCAIRFGGAFTNSITIALISTALTLYIGCMTAYALVRFRFIGRDSVSLATLAVRMVPPAVLLVPAFGLWNNVFCLDKDSFVGAWIRDVVGERGDVCLAGTHSGIILIHAAMKLPFVIWNLQSFVVQVPHSPREGARVDGAGPFHVSRRIVMPPINPGLAAAAIFTFLIAWNECLLASALAGRDTRTVPILIVNNTREFSIEWGIIMTTCMLLAVPPILFTLFASRQIIIGMTAGAVKG